MRSAGEAFASETLTVIEVLGLYCRVVLEPRQLLSDWCEFTLLLFDIATVLKLGDEAVQHCEYLRDAMVQYHIMHMRLMAQCRKPKLHAMHHVWKQLRKWRKNLSCFAPEREHKTHKQRALYCYRHMETALIVRAANDLTLDLQSPLLFKPCHLNNCKQLTPRDLGIPLLQLRFRRDVVTDVLHARSAQSATTPKGIFHVRDLVMLSGSMTYGVVVAFYELDGAHCVLLHPLQRTAASWTRCESTVHADLEQIRHSLIYRERASAITFLRRKW